MIRGYRVWDNQTKSYEWDREFVLSSSGELMELHSNHNGTWEYHFADTDRFVVEHETGLTDKNGKEIYEGDIVGIYQEYSDKEGSKTWEELEPWGQVTYEDSRARFGIWGDSPYVGEDKHFFDLVEGLEIIGNAHEDRELLND